MQTATSWLQEQIFNSDWKNISGEDKLKLFEQAKEIEKQQIIDAYDNGFSSGYDDAQGDGAIFEEGKEYFAETYVSKGSDETKTN